MKLKMKPRKKVTTFDPVVFLSKVSDDKAATDISNRHVVFRQGDPADAIFYIQKGKIKLAVISKQGKEAVVAILGAGDFFGEGCLAGQPLRMASATTMTECSIMRLEKARVIRLLHDQLAFSELLV